MCSLRVPESESGNEWEGGYDLQAPASPFGGLGMIPSTSSNTDFGLFKSSSQSDLPSFGGVNAFGFGLDSYAPFGGVNIDNDVFADTAFMNKSDFDYEKAGLFGAVASGGAAVSTFDSLLSDSSSSPQNAHFGVCSPHFSSSATSPSAPLAARRSLDALKLPPLRMNAVLPSFDETISKCPAFAGEFAAGRKRALSAMTAESSGPPPGDALSEAGTEEYDAFLQSVAPKPKQLCGVFATFFVVLPTRGDRPAANRLQVALAHAIRARWRLPSPCKCQVELSQCSAVPCAVRAEKRPKQGRPPKKKRKAEGCGLPLAATGEETHRVCLSLPFAALSPQQSHEVLARFGKDAADDSLSALLSHLLAANVRVSQLLWTKVFALLKADLCYLRTESQLLLKEKRQRCVRAQKSRAKKTTAKGKKGNDVSV